MLVREIKNIPKVIINWNNVEIDPLIFVGAVSARYNGVAKDAKPTPKPSRNLQNVSMFIGGKNDETKAPTRKANPAIISVFFYQKFSKKPLQIVPNIPPVANIALKLPAAFASKP